VPYRSQISDDANSILKTLKERQYQKQALEKSKRIWLMVFLVAFIISSAVIYYNVITPAGDDVLEILTNLARIQYVALIIITAVIYSCFKYYSDKAKDMAKSVEALRLEVVERFDAPWLKTKKSQIRDEISAEMINHGINIVHKS